MYGSKEEAELQTRAEIIMAVVDKYTRENCNKKGDQLISNLTTYWITKPTQEDQAGRNTNHRV